MDAHFRALERMYAAAPINAIYRPVLTVSEGQAVVEMEVRPEFHHAAGALHGSVYFKMLDDAAFFAANSLEPRYFVLTASFTVFFLRPVAEGRLRAVGRVVSQTRSQFIAEAVLYDAEGNEVGRGIGSFVRSKVPLTRARGYGE